MIQSQILSDKIPRSTRCFIKKKCMGNTNEIPNWTTDSLYANEVDTRAEHSAL